MLGSVVLGYESENMDTVAVGTKWIYTSWLKKAVALVCTIVNMISVPYEPVR